MLDIKLDEIAYKRSKKRKKLTKSYCMHTPKEALRNLGERSCGRKKH